MLHLGLREKSGPGGGPLESDGATARGRRGPGESLDTGHVVVQRLGTLDGLGGGGVGGDPLGSGVL